MWPGGLYFGERFKQIFETPHLHSFWILHVLDAFFAVDAAPAFFVLNKLSKHAVLREISDFLPLKFLEWYVIWTIKTLGITLGILFIRDYGFVPLLSPPG